MKDIANTQEALIKKLKNISELSKSEADYLFEADSKDVAQALRKLLTKGYNIQKLWQMSIENRQYWPNQAEKLKRELPNNHIILRILAEHEMLNCFVTDLNDMNNEVQKLDSGSSTTSEIRRIANISGHLLSMEQHRQREEDLIFPELENRVQSSLTLVVSQQHRRLSESHYKLNQLIWNIDKMNFTEFQIVLNNLVTMMVPEMQKHVFVENNIILPLALEYINENKFWKKVKVLSEEMGYCGYY